jgi:endonuclease/exonuclease/phosphatase family metal-dependent hydrolase
VSTREVPSAAGRRRVVWRTLALLLFLLGLAACQPAASTYTAADPVKDGYLFCFWNVENFFDDEVNGWKNDPDEDYDVWFAADGARIFKQKLANLTEALLKMNGGKGPDILALAEVETERAATLLMESLNNGLKGNKDKPDPYKYVAWKNPKGGRNIATAVISRVPIVADKTQLIGRRMRILEVHLEAGGQQLVVIASHWTSRVSDKEGDGRDKYGDMIYNRFKALHKTNPKVAFLVCGDFNDPPDDESVTHHLHAIGDLKKVKESGGDEPLLLNLLADKAGKDVGTHYYRKWYTFDQIAVSAGLLDDSQGWYCKPATAKIVSEFTEIKEGRLKGRPDRFGSKSEKIVLSERGWSDHFPVSVQLFVKGKK